MKNPKSWRRSKQPSIPIYNIGLLLIYLYRLKESRQPTRLFCHSYTTESGVENALWFPLYIASDKWLANEERPLEIEEPLSLGRDSYFRVDDEYLEWKRVRQLVTDDPVYRLVEVESLPNGDMRLSFSEGTYEQYISSCEIIYDELLAQLARFPALEELCRTKEGIRRNTDQLYGLWDRLPLRQHLAPDQQALTDFKLRCVKIGINVALAFRLSKEQDMKEDFWVTLISKRSPNLAEYPNVYGVIPAGTFQPCYFRQWPAVHNLEQDEEFDLRYTVLREYLEEVFNWGRTKISNLSPKQLLLESKEARDLIELAKGGKARFTWTGFAIALETAKVELSCLLSVDDPYYYKKYEKMLSPNYETSQIIQTLYQEPNIRPFLADLPIAPASAMALSLGLKVLTAPWFASPQCNLLRQGTQLHKLASKLGV